MIDLFKHAARKGLFLFDPETAHGMSIAALKAGAVPACRIAPDPRLRQSVAGLDFVNPLGMAAGYDKNAEVPEALLKIGFGFTEIGTVTPKPQSGNPRPRIFRAGRGRRRHQPPRLQQRRPRRRLRAAVGSARQRHDRRQHRRQQGQRRPHRRLCRRHPPFLLRRALFHRQHLLAEHAGPARPAGARKPRVRCLSAVLCRPRRGSR